MQAISDYQDALALIKQGGTVVYLDSNGNPQTYVPGKSHLASGTTLYDAGVAVTYQETSTQPGGSLAVNPALTGSAPPPEVNVQHEYGTPTPSPGAAGAAAPVPSGGGYAGESVPGLSQALLDAFMANAFTPARPSGRGLGDPEATDEGHKTVQAWQLLQHAIQTKVPSYLTTLNKLKSRSL